MNSYPLIIVTVIIYFLHSINAQTSFCNKECPITNMSRGVDMRQVHSHMQEMESLHIPNTSVQTAKLRSWHSHHAWHHYRHIRAGPPAHGEGKTMNYEYSKNYVILDAWVSKHHRMGDAVANRGDRCEVLQRSANEMQ
ncbi:hypothetical protein CsSME_00032598 [Camellia sinensis var. sinensis]